MTAKSSLSIVDVIAVAVVVNSGITIAITIAITVTTANLHHDHRHDLSSIIHRSSFIITLVEDASKEEGRPVVSKRTSINQSGHTQSILRDADLLLVSFHDMMQSMPRLGGAPLASTCLCLWRYKGIKGFSRAPNFRTRNSAGCKDYVGRLQVVRGKENREIVSSS